MYKYILRHISGYGFKRSYYAGEYNDYNIIKIMSRDHAEVFEESASAYLLARHLTQLGYEFRVEVVEKEGN